MRSLPAIEEPARRGVIAGEGLLKLRPVEQADDADALDLLVRGFPRRARDVWLNGLTRAAALQVRDPAWPLGFVMERSGVPCGVMLTLATRRPAQSLPTVNLCAWYVEPEARAVAPMMLMKVLAYADAVFTDLTPSVEVNAILPRLGFERWCEGGMAVLTPLAALRQSAAQVRAPEAPGLSLTDDHRRLLGDHDALGCLTTVLSIEGRDYPLVFANRQVRGLPTAHLVYAEDRGLVLSHLGALARNLIARGVMMITVDIYEAERVSASFFKPYQQSRQYRGNNLSNSADYAYSEFILFDWD